VQLVVNGSAKENTVINVQQLLYYRFYIIFYIKSFEYSLHHAPCHAHR